jgi:actin
VPKLYLGN